MEPERMVDGSYDRARVLHHDTVVQGSHAEQKVIGQVDNGGLMKKRVLYQRVCAAQPESLMPGCASSGRYAGSVWTSGETKFDCTAAGQIVVPPEGVGISGRLLGQGRDLCRSRSRSAWIMMGETVLMCVERNRHISDRSVSL